MIMNISSLNTWCKKNITLLLLLYPSYFKFNMHNDAQGHRHGNAQNPATEQKAKTVIGIIYAALLIRGVFCKRK